eukprot:2261914-Alexandrium_andersonii.AAC.1
MLFRASEQAHASAETDVDADAVALATRRKCLHKRRQKHNHGPWTQRVTESWARHSKQRK